jgi:hypothetical protein
MSPQIELNLKKEIHKSFTGEIPGHFMYNVEDNAIQQVLKLPDISVSDSSEKKGIHKNGLSLPPIASDERGSSGEGRSSTFSTTKLPKISNEFRQSSCEYTNGSWLENQDVCSVSWGKALDALDRRETAQNNLTRVGHAQKRRKKEGGKSMYNSNK